MLQSSWRCRRYGFGGTRGLYYCYTQYEPQVLDMVIMYAENTYDTQKEQPGEANINIDISKPAFFVKGAYGIIRLTLR